MSQTLNLYMFHRNKFNNFHILPTSNRLVKMKNLKPFSSKIYKGQLHRTSSVSAEKDPELMVFSTYSTPWPQRTRGYTWHSEKHQFPIKPEWNYSLIMKVLDPSRLYQESLLNCPRVQLSILDSNQCSMLHNKKASITQFYRKIPSRYRNNGNRLCMIMSGEKCQYVPMSLFTAFCKKSSGKWGSKIPQYLFWREFDKQLRFKKQQETL